MAELPSGVVTFVFTDIEGSTPLFERLGDDYRLLQERHRQLLRKAWADHGGHEIGTEGDSFFVAFADPVAAVEACVAAQRALSTEPWPDDARVRVRMGVHTGPAEPTDGNYTSLTVHAAARVMSAGNGGQIVVSEPSRSLARDAACDFVDCGLQHLRGFHDPVRLFLADAVGTDNDTRPLRASRVVTSNLPAVSADLVGRDQTVFDLKKMLEGHRLVTITGTGGVGKTRLALATAGEVADAFRDGAWFVDLHTLRTAEDVFVAVAGLLQVGDSRDYAAGIARSIGPGRVLLVLDNCEHLIEGAADLAHLVLTQCPNASVLVTSREPLGISGEHTWRAPSLRPEDAQLLLVQRITDVRGVSPGIDEEPHLATIAERLDGIPLALELAAARCAALSASDVAARLDERFRFLGASRRSLSRHQTLEAAVAWSVDLLDEPTRAVLRRLSVFAGGWTLEAVEAVTAFGGLTRFAAIDALQALVDKSLVQAHFAVTPTRYTFLETIRQFAQAELLRSGEAADAHRRHAEYFTELFARLDTTIPGPAEMEAVARADAEIDNLQAALDWSAANDDVATVALLISNASYAISLGGRYLELGTMVERALAAIEPAPERAPPAAYAGVLRASSRVSADHMYAFEVALERAQLAWDLANDAPEMSGRDKGACAGWLAEFLYTHGRREEAAALCEIAISLESDFPASQSISLAIYGGMLVESENGRTRALEVVERALALAERHDSAMAVAVARTGLGQIASLRGDAVAAQAALAPLCDIAARLPPAIAVECLAGGAQLLVSTERFEDAEQLANVAADIASTSGLVEAALITAFCVGTVAAAQGDMRRAEQEWTTAAELAARQGRILHAMLARYRLTWLADERGDRMTVRRLLEEAKPYAFRLGSLPQTAWLLLMGHEEFVFGDRVRGRAHLEEAVDSVRGHNFGVQVGAVFDHLSDIFYELGRPADAVRLSAACFAHLTEAEFRTTASVMRWRRRQARDAELAATFAPDAYAALQAEGRDLSPADVLKLLDDLTGIPD